MHHSLFFCKRRPEIVEATVLLRLPYGNSDANVFHVEKEIFHFPLESPPLLIHLLPRLNMVRNLI